MRRRLILWLAAGLLVFLVDLGTKAAPHDRVAHNAAHTPAIVFLGVAAFLFAVALWHSNLIAVGAGLMFGALCGNAGELLVLGYATDWIPLGGWLTNVADLAGAAGFICCVAGYIRQLTAGKMGSGVRRLRPR